jgi:outer membrane protein OmpA-like peptidoglycan-associated protein
VDDVLLRSKAIAKDPVKGEPNLLYYNQILKDLMAENFHPGSTVESDGTLQSEVKLEPLSEEKWSALRPVAALQTEEIVFAPGTDRLTDQSKESLLRLAASLKKWPTFYVKIQGTPRVGSNPQAAKELALQRSQATAAHLAGLGIDPNRIKATATEPGKQAKVAFVLGQAPY